MPLRAVLCLVLPRFRLQSDVDASYQTGTIDHPGTSGRATHGRAQTAKSSLEIGLLLASTSPTAVQQARLSPRL